MFGPGDGQDRIEDAEGANVLSFGAGILPGNVAVVRGQPTIVLEIMGTGDRIDLGVAPDLGMAISAVEFAGGQAWTPQMLIDMALAATAGDDVIFGSDAAQTLTGLAGDDLLIALDGADDLAGGAGVDRLEGGLGDDTYRFGLGDDQDRITDAGGAADVLILGAGITEADISVSQSSDGSAIILAIGDDSDRVRIDGALSDGRIETVRFADNTEWSVADLLTRAPTVLDDVLFGDVGDDTIDAGLGDDRISGGTGNDTYLFTRGDGRDIIRDASRSDADTLSITGYTADEIRFVSLGTDSTDIAVQFAGPDDQIIIAGGIDMGGEGIETITLVDDGTTFTIAQISALLVDAQSSDGDDQIFGTSGDDILAVGLGDDLMAGGNGDDVYLYAIGDGDDRIDALGRGDSEVRLSDYNLADVAMAVRAGPESDDLVITFSTPGDRLVLVDGLGAPNGAPGSLSLVFADGSIWTRAEMRAATLNYIQTDGADNLWGYAGDDLFTLTPGDDFAVGLGGADTYQMALGDGHNRIDDSGMDLVETDRVEFTGLSADDASVSRLFRGSDAVLIEFTGNDADSLTVLNALTGDARGIEQYVFDSGEIWTRETLLMLLDNNAPVANDDGFFAVTTGETLVIQLDDILGNDFDADDDALRIVSVDGSPDGAALINGDGDLEFTSAAAFTGSTAIRYSITDDRNAFSEAVINVNVRPLAEARDDDGFATAEDTFLTIRVERLLSNDVDGDRMIVAQVFDAVGGTASFRYAANTPEGGRAEADVFIDVTPVNDAPVGVNDAGFVMDEGGSLRIAPVLLTLNDIDVDGDALILQSVLSSVDLLIEIDLSGDIIATPRDDFFGTATFTYTVADPDGEVSTATATVTVNAVNDAPELADDRFELTEAGGPILEDNPIILSLARLTSNDIDAEGDPLTLIAVGSTFGGSATLLENQTVLFEPGGNFNGDARFTYIVSDGQGGTASAVATIVYQPVNDRPDARADSYTNNALPILSGVQDQVMTIPILELLKNDFDIEGFAVTFENATGGINGDLEVIGTDIVFTPDLGFFGEATFGYSITDPEGLVDGAQVTMFFEGTSDSPPFAGADQFLVAEDIPTVIRLDTLLGNDADVDGDALEIIGWRMLNGLGDAIKFGGVAAGPLNGTIEQDINGDLLFTPFIDANFSSGFVYLVTDNSDGTTEGFVDIVIVPSNDDPTIVDDPGFVSPFDVPLVIRASDLVFNDFDIEQADSDLDGTIDDDLDGPDRDRPTFVGVAAILDPVALAQGNRVDVGVFEIVEFGGEEFVIARFDAGFTGPVTIEYRIADVEGLEDTGFAYASVADFYGAELTGSPFVDVIEGNALDEVIRGYRGADWIRALGGNDLIEAGDGDDLIEAGTGDDTIDAGNGGDDIRGGTGFDTVLFTGSNTGVRADLSTLIGQGGYAQGDFYSGIEAFEGTGFNDTLGGDDEANRLVAAGGDDELIGRGGDDTLLGGLGDDTLDGGAGADIVTGGEGRDEANYFFSDAGISIDLLAGTASGGWAAGDTLSGIEDLTGTDFDDTLTGNDEDNTLSGGRGADVLSGGLGDDVLSGGRGGDSLFGGDGIDTVVYTLSNDGITIDLANGIASGGDAEGDTFDSIEIIEASFQADDLRGDDNDNIFRGSRGADSIDGRGGFDTADYTRADEAVWVDLSTGAGLSGEALGDDLTSIEALIGSVHNDTFVGSDGTDVLDGRFGDDLLQDGDGGMITSLASTAPRIRSLRLPPALALTALFWTPHSRPRMSRFCRWGMICLSRWNATMAS